MSFSQATLVQRVRTIMGDNPFAVPCTDNVAQGDTTIDVPDGTEWSEGNVGEYQDDGEQFYVRSVSSNTLTVIRGWNGTTAAAHDGSGTAKVIFKNPRVSYIKITTAVTQVMNALNPYVYRTHSFTITPTATETWQDVGASNTAIHSLIQVTQALTATSPKRVFYYGMRNGAYPVALAKNLPTSVATNTVALYMPYLKDETATINVLAAAPIDATVATGSYSYISEGVEVDSVVYFTAAELLGAMDVIRTTQEDVAQGDTGTKPLQRTQLADYWRRRGTEARRQWEEQLRRDYPLFKNKHFTSPSEVR